MENKFKQFFVPQGKEKTRGENLRFEKTRGENLRFLIYKFELSIRFWLKKKKPERKTLRFLIYIY